MRLVFVLPSYEPSWEFGGIVTSMSTLCRGLVGHGVDVTVYTTNVSASGRPLEVPLDRPVELGGVHVWYFEATYGPGGSFYSRDLIKNLGWTAAGFDAVYVSATWQWSGLECVRACRDASVPMIVGTHGSFSAELSADAAVKDMLYRELFFRKALRGASAVHLTAHSEGAVAGSWFEGMRTFVVPNAADPWRFRPIADAREGFRAMHGIPMGAPVVISVGHRNWMRRNDLVIRAIAETDDWWYVMAGPDTGEKAQEWGALARELEVDDRFVQTGFLDFEPLAEALSAADIFALVSDYENFGTAAVEGMMCGLPVMLSSEVGLCENICGEDFAFTVEKTDEAITRRLSRFLSHGIGRYDIRDGARRFAVERFSPYAVAKCFIAEVEKVLGARRAHMHRAHTADVMDLNGMRLFRDSGHGKSAGEE